MLANAGNDTVLAFDFDGNKAGQFRISGEALRNYGSFAEYAQSDPNAKCESPKETPPPGCVACKNGKIVCSGAKFARLTSPRGEIQ